MDKKNFDRLLESVTQAKKIMAGKRESGRRFIFEGPNPKEIRAKMSLTQDQFATLMNISVHTLRNWEQGRRQPEGPARVLLNVANNYPEVLEEMLIKVQSNYFGYSSQLRPKGAEYWKRCSKLQIFSI